MEIPIDKLKMLESILRQAVFDSVVECPYCGKRWEPDYYKCVGEDGCGKVSPLQEYGMI